LGASKLKGINRIAKIGYGLLCLRKEKSLKIPKEYSEFAYRRRTDNIIAKRKNTKRQTTIYIELKIE
jgi:hypothetical protein